MFYDNKNVLYTTYKLLINATEKLDLVNNIKEAFENINSKEILDKQISYFLSTRKDLKLFKKEKISSKALAF